MINTNFPLNDEKFDGLAEIVLDHFGIPRQGQIQHVDELQDTLLHEFLATSRHLWLAASPFALPSTDPIYRSLHDGFEASATNIQRLNNIFEEIGAHDMLRDVAHSPDVSLLAEVPVDPYEERLLRAAGHPYPGSTVKSYLRYAASEPEILSLSKSNLERAGKITIKAHNENAAFPPKQPSNQHVGNWSPG